MCLEQHFSKQLFSIVFAYRLLQTPRTSMSRTFLSIEGCGLQCNAIMYSSLSFLKTRFLTKPNFGFDDCIASFLVQTFICDSMQTLRELNNFKITRFYCGWRMGKSAEILTFRVLIFGLFNKTIDRMFYWCDKTNGKRLLWSIVTACLSALCHSDCWTYHSWHNNCGHFQRINNIESIRSQTFWRKIVTIGGSQATHSWSLIAASQSLPRQSQRILLLPRRPISSMYFESIPKTNTRLFFLG